MKKLLQISLLALLIAALLCGCMASGITLNDPSEESAAQETEFVSHEVTYEVGKLTNGAGEYSEDGVYHYIVRSRSELAELYGGTIPAGETTYDDAFFAEHSLIVVNLLVHFQTYALPIGLNETAPGVYSLRFDTYCQEITTPVDMERSIQLVYEVDKVLEEDAQVQLVSDHHVLSTREELYALYEKLDEYGYDHNG